MTIPEETADRAGLPSGTELSSGTPALGLIVDQLRRANVMSPAFWAFPMALAAILVLVALYDFVVFHTLAEFFAIAVAMVMFALAWHTSDFARNQFLIFLACGFFWIGVLDLAHALAYKGIELLPYSGPNAASQLWIVTRYYEAVLLVAAPLLSGRGIGKLKLFLANGVLAGLLALWVETRLFPDTFIEPGGLTAFKIASEYAIILILCVAAWAMIARRWPVAPEEATLMVCSVVLTILAELAFTFYIDVFGFSNLVGHILKLFSYWLFFQSVVAHNLRKPYIELHRTLQQSRQSREAAEHANRAKSDFLSMMSHDLRTPLNAIMGFSDLMRLETFGPLGDTRYREYVESIHKSGAHLVHLINDILDVSKIESGNYPLEEEAIDLGALFEDIHLGFDAYLPAGRGRVRLDLPDGAPRLYAERRAMAQIAANLVGNAIKFSDGGEPVTVAWEPVGASGSWSLTVRDRGCGIARDKLDRITEPFFQGDPHLSRRHGGIGLGLHIVKLLAGLHGARLEIESEIGVGTTARVCFPAHRILPALAATGEARSASAG